MLALTLDHAAWLTLVDLVRSSFFVRKKKTLTRLIPAKIVHTKTGVGSSSSATKGENVEATTDMKLTNPYDVEANKVGNTWK